MPTLRELRIRSYLSQQALARAARVPRESISRYENGHKKPGPRTVEALAAALKVEPQQICFPADGRGKAQAASHTVTPVEQLELFRLILDNGIRDLLPGVPDQTIARFFGRQLMVEYISRIKSVKPTTDKV